MTEQQQPGREVAVVPATPAREVATMDTDSWVQIMQPVIWLAERISGTEFVPKSLRNSVPATAAAILYGREVGLGPMTSLTQTHVIEGRPSMSAEAMRAMILAQGHELVFEESTGAVCTIRARRSGSEHWTRLSWSIDMARAAGVLGKDNWKKYPRAMLVARCTTDVARMVFPDVIHGFRSIEEVQDLADDDAPEGAGGGSAPSGTTTKVSRRRPAKKAAAAPAKQLEAPAGPPLPGDPGFDQGGEQPPTETAGGGDKPDDGGSAARDAESPGEDIEGAPSSVTDAPESDTGTAGESMPVTPGGSDSGAQAGDPGEAEPDAAPAHDPGSPDDEEKQYDPTGPRLRSNAQNRMAFGLFSGLGIKDDREERLLVTSKIVGRAVETSNDLTADEASTLIDTLGRVKDRKALNDLLDTIDAAEEERAKAERGEGDES